MRKRIKLIANPISGGDARPRIERAKSFLEAAGAQVDLFMTCQRGDATDESSRLDSADYDVVIAAGGDGTLNEVANGLAGRKIPLAFVPLGTANVMALEMGLPLTVEEACHVALFGEALPVTLAETGGAFFLMMAGIGYDAAAVRAVNPRLKRHTGKFAYLFAGLKALVSYRPVAFRVQNAEGESLAAWHAIISNIRLYGGCFIMAPHAGLATSTLTACLVDRPGRLALGLFWLRILLRGRIFGPVHRIESTSFRIDGLKAPVQIDGDDFGHTPLQISCRTGQLTMIFPR